MTPDVGSGLLAARDGVLKNFDLRWHDDVALTVVMAANGYPGAYQKGSVIEGLEEAAQIEGVEIFHAGTIASDGSSVMLSISAILRMPVSRLSSRKAITIPPRRLNTTEVKIIVD